MVICSHNFCHKPTTIRKCTFRSDQCICNFHPVMINDNNPSVYCGWNMHMRYKGVIFLQVSHSDVTAKYYSLKMNDSSYVTFTLRLGSLTLWSTPCCVKVHIWLPNQATCMKTNSRRCHLPSQPCPTQCNLSIPKRKFLLTCIIIPHWPLLFFT